MHIHCGTSIEKLVKGYRKLKQSQSDWSVEKVGEVLFRWHSKSNTKSIIGKGFYRVVIQY